MGLRKAPGAYTEFAALVNSPYGNTGSSTPGSAFELVTPPISILLVIEEVRELVAVRTALAKRLASEDE